MIGSEDQREQVTLLFGQRRQAVHDFLDISAQLILHARARGTGGAALSRPCLG